MMGANTDSESGQMKGPWNHFYTSNNISHVSASEDNGYTKLSGFSWPPRLYVCSFCKREFKSAQALGGHMNVHRRDRARLRQSPPTSPSSSPITNVAHDSTNLNLIPNPNPNLTYVIQKPNNITSNYIIHSSTIPYLKPPTSPLIISTSSGASVNGTVRRSVTRPNPNFTTSTSTKTLNLINGNNKEHHHDHDIPYVNINKAREKRELMKLGFSNNVLRNYEDVDLELRLGYSS